ncbi:MAG: hypothetical protein HC769_09095 [Cyanobacteria bacterium CRU_2_1]|nr:hypothetical protein [Cyanobacteria bacterium RU_5_0]NJR58989.1 hypothetical protein [Cyanobacteria bacterium CRU_2_1]
MNRRPLITLTLIALTASLAACGRAELQSSPPANQDGTKPEIQDVLPDETKEQPQLDIAKDDTLDGDRPDKSQTPNDSQSEQPLEEPSQELDQDESSQEQAVQPASPLPEVNGINLGDIEYVSSVTDPDPILERAILQALPGYDNNLPSELKIRYSYNRVDLNGDGQPEVLAYLSGSFTCGTGGCTMMIFKPAGQDYQLVSKVRLVNSPVLISAQSTAGWSDLVLLVSGGGAEPHYALLQSDGSTYPANPSVAVDIPDGSTLSGTAVLTDQMVASGGVLLEPVQ